MKDNIHDLVARVTIWSMRAALKGKWPSLGAFGEPLEGPRAAKAGEQLAGGYRLAYHGFKADAKARREMHRFNRTYGHSKICETCFAERPNVKGDPLLTFKNFYPDAAHLMTELSHRDYVASSDRLSPWENMPGFHVKSLFRDPMHTVYLGTAKEVLASCLGYWNKNGCLPGNNLEERLRWVSQQQKEVCAGAGLKGSFKTFTPANTGLDKSSEFPELGSSFKAATMKTSVWYFAKLAGDISLASPEDWVTQKNGFELVSKGSIFLCHGTNCVKVCLRMFVHMYFLPQDFNLKLIAVCLWSLHAAIQVMDFNDLILSPGDAEAKRA